MQVTAPLRQVAASAAWVLLTTTAVFVLSGRANADFYAPPPATSDTAAGTVLRSEPLAIMGGSPLADLLPVAAATRIMYRSTDTAGSPVITTGAVLVPSTGWSGPGPRPLITYAVGTHGAGDSCAPSKLLADGLLVDGASVPIAEFNIPDLIALLTRGFTVVLTDYRGLGTPGPAPYFQPLPQAYDVLDAARAAINIGAATADTPIGIWGYSQGGGAAAAAAEEAREYAPDLNIKAAVTAAVPANIAEVLRFNDTSTTLHAITGYFLNGLIGTHPELTARITALLNLRSGLPAPHRRPMHARERPDRGLEVHHRIHH